MRAKQGYASVGVDLRIVDDEGREQPWDGDAMGEIQVRGPWIIRPYYDNPESADRFTADGWFRTGDVATIDPEGYVQITDRTKDLIKSGGEWISSIDVETMIMGHPKVLEAAVIAVPHPKWVERPLACVVPKPGRDAGAPGDPRLPAPPAGQVGAARRGRPARVGAQDQRGQVRQEGPAAALQGLDAAGRERCVQAPQLDRLGVLPTTVRQQLVRRAPFRSVRPLRGGAHATSESPSSS